MTTSEEMVIELLDADDPVEADGYSIALNIPGNEMRIKFTHEEFGPLSSFICSAPEAYELAQRILRGYDKLEGL